MFKALLMYLSSFRYTIDAVGEVISSVRCPGPCTRLDVALRGIREV